MTEILNQNIIAKSIHFDLKFNSICIESTFTGRCGDRPFPNTRTGRFAQQHPPGSIQDDFLIAGCYPCSFQGPRSVADEQAISVRRVAELTELAERYAVRAHWSSKIHELMRDRAIDWHLKIEIEPQARRISRGRRKQECRACRSQDEFPVHFLKPSHTERTDQKTFLLGHQF